jgi:hypothetical protein
VCLGGGIIEFGERMRDDSDAVRECPPGAVDPRDEG